MVKGMKVVVVMPAYNAAKTLHKTYREVDFDIVDQVILVDDASNDNTPEVAKQLGIQTIVHLANKGYGGNQKTCYRAALQTGADIVIMLHPDYQYTPKLIGPMAHLISTGLYDIVMGSRILPKGAIAGGMPVYKYLANRILTFIENILLGQKLSEYHSGFRAFHWKVLETLPLEENSDNFVFDNQILAQAVHFNFKIGEISCPTMYFKEASSINLRRSIVYGLGVLKTGLQFRLHRWGLVRFAIFDSSGGRLMLRS